MNKKKQKTITDFFKVKVCKYFFMLEDIGKYLLYGKYLLLRRLMLKYYLIMNLLCLLFVTNFILISESYTYYENELGLLNIAYVTSSMLLIRLYATSLRHS